MLRNKLGSGAPHIQAVDSLAKLSDAVLGFKGSRGRS
jgi:hypothetical protein